MPIEARNRPLPDWFTRIRTRQTVLPRFQRFEAWGHGNVIQLFNTILQDLPVGAVLVLEIGDEEPFVSRTIQGAPTTGERVSEHLLDGQQRLTALWRALHNNYEERTYFLYFQTDEETGMQYYVDSIARWTKENDLQPRPVWANHPKEQWKRRMIPLDLCAPDITATKGFANGPGRRSKMQTKGMSFQMTSRLSGRNSPRLTFPSCLFLSLPQNKLLWTYS
jgi:hypothetical protein